jgi:TolB-like protein/DNA-binding winged helix-turn-helix (wHTH) protein
MPGTIYEFGDFRLDCGRFELVRAGQSLRLERKPLELLIFLAEKNGQLATREEIAQRLWQSEVFVDTEHGINTAVRKIRNVLRDDAEESRYIQTVTGKGYRFIAPLKIVYAQDKATSASTPANPVPALEDGSSVALAASQQLSSSSHHLLGRARIAVVSTAVLALLAVGLFATVRWIQSRGRPAIASLAVLPLDNLSGDPAQDYFADGMTDELTTMLAKDSTLRIISRTSVMQYKHARQPLKDIARALGADGIVEGSVARNGDHVHLNLQLIQAATDSHLWAESYDRDAHDVALSDEAARAIAVRLHSPTSTATPPRAIDPAAHDAYLHGRYLWLSSRDSESGAYYKKATEIQPDYAAAWAGLANYYGKAAAGDELDPRIALPLEEKAAERAIALDPNLAEAHLAVAATYLIARWDPVNADREVLRVISLDPSDGEAYNFRANVLDALGRHQEALEMAKKAVEISPFEYAADMAAFYVSGRQYDAALADLGLRLEVAPNDPLLLYFQWDTLRRKGNYREAADALEKSFTSSGDTHSASAIRSAWEHGGWPAVVRWQLAHHLERQKREYVSPVTLAGYHAQLHETEPTLSLLEEGFRQHSTDILWVTMDPAFDFLDSDPRFQSILQRINLPVTSIANPTR